MNLCPKNGVINCIHTHKISILDVEVFLTEKFFMLQQWKLWGKIYEFIYMPPLLLPLPVHMCVKTIFLGYEKNFFNFFYCTMSRPLLRLSSPIVPADIASTMWFLDSFSRGRRSLRYFRIVWLSPKESVLTLNFELTWEAIS